MGTPRFVVGRPGPHIEFSTNANAYAPAAMACAVIWACNSGEHFNVKPQRLQRIRKFPPRGITGMKNSVNHRFDSIAVNTVGRLHLEQGY